VLIKNEHTRGMLLTLLAVLILSPDALLVRLISADIWTLLFWRGTLSGLTLFVFLLTIYRQKLFDMLLAPGRFGLLASAVIAGGSILFVGSIRMTSTANTLVILASIPLLAALGTRIFLSEPISRQTWFSIIFAFVGVLVLFSGSLGYQSLLGDLMALGAACCWAGNLVIVRRVRPLNMIPANACGNLLLAPIALLFNAQPLTIQSADITLLLILGTLVLPLSYALITLAPRLLSAPEVSLTLLLETLLGPFWVWLVIHEEPSAATIAGGILILGTITIHTLVSMRQGPVVSD